MTVGEVFLFILSAIGQLILNLFGHIVVKHYTSSHIILVLILGEIGLAFKDKRGWKEIVQFVHFCLALFILLIFTEIIEINACDLEKNTRKNIELRERLEKYYNNKKENCDINNNSLRNSTSSSTKIEMDGVEIDFHTNSIINYKSSISGRYSDISEEDMSIN